MKAKNEKDIKEVKDLKVKDKNDKNDKYDINKANNQDTITIKNFEKYYILKVIKTSIYNSFYRVKEYNQEEEKENQIDKKYFFYSMATNTFKEYDKSKFLNRINVRNLIYNITENPPVNFEEYKNAQLALIEKNKKETKSNAKKIEKSNPKDAKNKKNDDKEKEEEEPIIINNPNIEEINNFINTIKSLNEQKNFYFPKIESIKISSKNDYLNILTHPNQYSLQELITKNPSGLDLKLIKSIIYQLCKSVKFIKRKGFTYNSLTTNTINLNLKRIAENMTGYEDKMLHLSSNANINTNEIHLHIEIGDISRIKKIKKEIPKEVDLEVEKKKKTEIKKKPVIPKKDNKKDVKGGGKNAKDVKEVVIVPGDNFLVEEMLNDEFYFFDPFKAPEIVINQIFKNYNDDQIKMNDVYSDMWSIGCIMAELIDGNPLFPLANNDYSLLWYINKLKKDSLTNEILKFKEFNINFEEEPYNTVYVNDANNTKVDLNLDIKSRYLGKASKEAIDLLEKFLNPNYKERISIEDVFNHPFLYPFHEDKEIFGNFKKVSQITSVPKTYIESDFKKLNLYDKNKNLLEKIIQTKEVMSEAKNLVEIKMKQNVLKSSKEKKLKKNKNYSKSKEKQN